MGLMPLNINRKLALAPQNKPRHAVQVEVNGEVFHCADPKAVRILVALMDLSAVNGGASSHWGGTSAMGEIFSALHSIMFKKEDWFNHYNFVNDIGHIENGVYALRSLYHFNGLDNNALKGFRGIKSPLTGHGESHLYPEGVLISNGPLGSSLPQAQGLALSDKMIGNKRATICTISDGASFEGEAKEAFAAIPGLHSKGLLNPFLMIVSNNKKKASGKTEDSYSMIPTFDSFKALGWEVISLENAHYLKEVLSTIIDGLKKAENKPVCILANTIKGYGVKKTAEEKSGSHGFPLKAYSEEIFDFIKELWGSEDVPSEFMDWASELVQKPNMTKAPKASAPEMKMQAHVSKALEYCTSLGLPVVSFTSDLQSSTGVSGFHKTHPDRAVDIGIAESNMISSAIGASLNGLIPVVDTFAAFGVTKGNLPLIMSSLSSAPMIAIFTHTGFQDAADGASHQSLTYMSALASIPNVKLVVPSTASETYKLLVDAILDIKNKREKDLEACSYVFFLGRENYPEEIYPQDKISLNKAYVLKEGNDVTLVSTGPLLHTALLASSILEKEGMSVEVINNVFVNHVDTKTIGESISKTKRLLTLEDHQVIGGMGSLLTHRLKNEGYAFHLKSLGVRGEFGRSAYTASELYKLHGLDELSVVNQVKELLKKD